MIKKIKLIYALFIATTIILYIIYRSPFEGNCEDLKMMYKNQECVSIVRELPQKDKIYFTMKNGYNPFSKKECICKDEGRLWARYIKDIEIGDTIIKRKGELTFYIHKKDTLITHYWECGGKVHERKK